MPAFMIDEIEQSCTPFQSPFYLLMNSLSPQDMFRTQIEEIEPKIPQQKKRTQGGKGGQEKDCRICLEGEKMGRLEKYCSCSGTAEFAHQKCISQWILKKENEKKRFVKCQVCHQPYNYAIDKQSKLTCEQFSSHWNQKRTQILIFSIAILLCTCGLAFFISTAYGTGLQSEILRQKMASSEVFFMGIVIGIIIWFFVIVTLLYIFISKFLLKSFKIVRLDKSKSIKLMKLEKSIRQYLNSKAAATQ